MRKSHRRGDEPQVPRRHVQSSGSFSLLAGQGASAGARLWGTQHRVRPSVAIPHPGPAANDQCSSRGVPGTRSPPSRTHVSGLPDGSGHRAFAWRATAAHGPDGRAQPPPRRNSLTAGAPRRKRLKSGHGEGRGHWENQRQNKPA